jgi:hypothetical protein
LFDTMLSPRCPWLALLSLQQPISPAPLSDPSFGYPLHLAPGEQLLEYAWDDGARVPFLSAARDVFISFGELGLGERALLYLPSNSLLEAGTTGAQVLVERGLGAAVGRYGQGFDFGASTFLKLALPAPGTSATGWSLSFWLQPRAEAFGRVIALLPGAAEILLQADGRLRAHLLPSGPDVLGPVTLRAGEWQFVSLDYDPSASRQARLCVGDARAGRALSVPIAPRSASELWLGDLAQNGQGWAGVIDELTLEDVVNSSATALRRANPPLAPGRHRLTLRTTLGLRQVELAAGATRTLVLDDEADFATGQFDGVVYESGALTWVPARWKELAPRVAPPARTAYPEVEVGGGRLLIFGGETRDTHQPPGTNSNDTWLYDPAANRWDRVSSAAAPSERCHTPMAYSPDDDLVLLVGGWRNDVTPNLLFNDTWVFHVTERRWEQRFPAGATIGSGSSAGLVYLPALRRFLLNQGRRNFLYDPVADTHAELPSARVVDENGQPATFGPWISPMMVLDPRTGLVIVFGGTTPANPAPFSDQTALYDVQANQYTVLAPPVHPAARVRGGYAFDPRAGRVVLFGGVLDQYSTRFRDLWVFDPALRTWRELSCSNRPERRGGFYGMGYDSARDRFLLFGGRQAVDRWLDETWSLEFSRGRPGTALYTFDRVDARGTANWFADVETPGNSSVQFLFRTSETGSLWSGWGADASRFPDRRFLQVVAFLSSGAGGVVPRVTRMGLR